MNRFLIFLLLCNTFQALAQSFAPAPGQVGSTAIHKDSSIIINWASNIELTRGYLNIANPTAGFATFGEASFALGAAEGDGLAVVSLGDSGIAILTFNSPITNLPGPDFAIFENGFADNYMEFAHVEVSSDGINYFRFPSVSETPLSPQLNNFSFSDCRYVHNLAGKYRQGYGTPFDLDELLGDINLNTNAITHVKLIDVVGSVDSQYGTYDSFGNLINDSYPTEFASGGFDLDAVAVLHELPAKLDENNLSVSIFPNPTNGILFISTSNKSKLKIVNSLGQLLYENEIVDKLTLDVSVYSEKFLFIELNDDYSIKIERVVVN